MHMSSIAITGSPVCQPGRRNTDSERVAGHMPRSPGLPAGTAVTSGHADAITRPAMRGLTTDDLASVPA